MSNGEGSQSVQVAALASGPPVAVAEAQDSSVSVPSVPSEVPRGKDTRKHAVQYSHFYPPPPMTTKYVTSSYIKTDQQTIAGREAANGARVTWAARKRKAGSAEDGDSDDEGAESDKSLAARTIIIHPGSTHVRVGLATDVGPVQWPNVLARRSAKAEAPSKSAKASSPDAPQNGTSGARQQGEDEEMEGTVEGEAKKADPLEARIGLLRADLRSIMRNMKLRGVSNGKGLAASYNAQVQPEKVPSHNDFGDEWTPEKPKESREVELGERALRIPSLSPSPGKEAEVQAKQDGRPWKLYRPFRAGKLNYASYMDDFGSAAERVLINDTQAIFEGIISSPREDLSAPGKSVEGMGQTLYGLGIPRKQYSAHSVILLVPDLFPKYDLRALTQLLLVDMGFSQIIVQQESTAATYGAGMSSACVIHAGGERISISCVDEGLLLQETRMHLDYGGEDVTQFLHQLLVRANFGYKDCSPALRVADTLVLEDLKKQMITLDASQIGLFIFNFYLRLPSVATKKWEVRVYDEAILAPMALFGLGVRVIDFAKKDEERKAEAEWGQKDDEDLDDGSERRYAITLAMNSSVRHLIPQAAPTPAPAAPAPTNGGEEAADSTTPSRDTNGASTPGPAGGSSNMTLSASNDGQQKAPTPARSTPAPPPLAFFDVRKASSQLPLDVALYHSLLASTTAGGTLATGEERMKKLASNILVVGGSARIPGLDGVIEARLVPHLEAHAASRAEASSAAIVANATAIGGATAAAPSAASSSAIISPSVIPPPRDLDPTLLAWKGMAVLPRLESANEMWVTRNEWDALGWKGVRDKALYL